MALYKVIRSFVKFIDEILNGMAKGVAESISADRGYCEISGGDTVFIG